ACSREDLYGGQTFTQTVAQAYADCNESEIRFLASKQGLQTVFDNCGSNNFAAFSWSPDGRWLYFELTHGGYILDGETKDILTVPTEAPVARAAWLRPDLLAIPLGPPEGATDDHGRIALLNRSAGTLDELKVPLSALRDLQPDGQDGLVLTGLDDQGRRRIRRIDVATGALTVPWTFLDAVDAETGRVDFAPDAGLIGVAGPEGGRLLKADDGSVLVELPGVKRVIPHHEGRYIALEVDGAPVSPFDMRAWDELSPEARERELQRQKKWLEKQPDWVTKEIIPPEVQVLDLQKGARYRITSWWGDRFQWYKPRNYYFSAVMFGIEGKQLNTNVILGDLREKLRMLDKGEVPLGMEVIAGEPAAPAAGTEASPTPSPGADRPTP
ncbi:MAG: hypothetical protein D6798_02795, partial [Deltaproteobacteria bacterium]